MLIVGSSAETQPLTTCELLYATPFFSIIQTRPHFSLLSKHVPRTKLGLLKLNTLYLLNPILTQTPMQTHPNYRGNRASP